MPRRSRDREDRLGQLLTQVERRFQNSPLEAIGRMLTGTLTEIRESALSNPTPDEAVTRIADYTSVFLRLLPSTFGERFTFDFNILSALVADCTQLSELPQSNYVPRPSSGWGHQIVRMPAAAGRSTPFFDLIHVPGEDNLSDVNLLEYPFACHELGHELLKKQGDGFRIAFSKSLDEVANGLQRQTLALQGSAKEIAAETIAGIRRFWTPTDDHFNWAHEIAVDIVALWTCGPAYIAALHDVMERPETNPYQLDQDHPPYELRAKALIEAAIPLGWSYYTGEYHNLLDAWTKSHWARGRANLYAACADTRLVTSSVEAALDACRSLLLPCCTPTILDSIRAKLSDQELPDLGLELITAAWLHRNGGTEEAYLEWEGNAIRGHLDIIKALDH
ncbi:hypothetical protein VT84_07455 [Gemmata sp. SH-PL17]|uniref:hypothetical protein n=1 Tax=Gemmata sp. SH-PL17 TaxID=1630693 RepID=UPI00078DDDF5|nr:hypothetical protein [Gemmata sp. SH-PL17]AMV24217.1 hypothetical protein VT84_07455 [Gemmata sp. SH-PL17]